MKITQRAIGIFFVAVVVGILASASSAKAQRYHWNLTSFVPIGSGTWKAYQQPFIDLVEELTDRQVTIKGFSVGVLASPFDAWMAVKMGTADICFCYPGFAVNADPANAILGGLAGGMSSEVYMHWLLAGEGGGLWRRFRRNTSDLHPVITGFGPTEIFLHSHRKVQKIEDLRGMKIRTIGAWADILTELGASPTILAPAEIFIALERRMIDATEFLTPSTNLKVGFQKIAKFIIIPGVHQPTHANEVVWRAAVWDQLPRRLQRQITVAGELAGLHSYMTLGIKDLEAMKRLRAGRNEWVELDPAFRAKVTKLARKWTFDQAMKQSAKGNPWMQRIAESYWGFYDRFQMYGDYRYK